MKILLLGDFSGLHVNLGDGLRELGHTVTVASDGNGYKQYKRDIDISWNGRFRYFKMIWKLMTIFPRFLNYDVVQLVGMPFLDLRPLNNEIVFRCLKLFNKHVFLGSNTTELEYVRYASEVGFKASFMNIKRIIDTDPWAKKYINGIIDKRYRKIHERVTDRVEGVTACCTEYKMGCDLSYSDKSIFIPLPYQVNEESMVNTIKKEGKVRFFLGMQNHRAAIKGMDVIKAALIDLKAKHPDEVEITIVDSVPYDEYRKLMEGSHVICDQLYSYGAGLNAVIALSKGLIVVGGGEEYMYELFGEKDNKPIINLPDTKEGVVQVLESLLERRDELPHLAIKSREFALKYHDHIKVAQQYVDFWESKML